MYDPIIEERWRELKHRILNRISELKHAGYLIKQIELGRREMHILRSLSISYPDNPYRPAIGDPEVKFYGYPLKEVRRRSYVCVRRRKLKSSTWKQYATGTITWNDNAFR